jgi:hypothetical protein
MFKYQAAAFAVLAMTVAFSGSAQAQAMPTNNPEAKANVRESEAYTALLRSNPAFRRQREKIECGPITDPQLRQSCISSFEAYASPAPSKRRSR